LKNDFYLAFEVESPQDASAQLKVEEPKKLSHSNSRDYSMLKLESDQGKKEPVE
jgi:hypothetical protein